MLPAGQALLSLSSMSRAMGVIRAAVSTDRHRHGSAYSAPVDGYRGLFVLLVVAYHLGVRQLGGGWIGINHFFVFSGFLIAGILLREHQRYGDIDVLRFYARRARRVLPAMLLLVVGVLAVTTATGWGDRRQTAGDAAATATLWINWRLVARDDQYFDLFAEPSPLRHAWTLGVEEQFYLLAPFVVLLALRVLRTRAQRVGLMVALAVALAGWSHHLVGTDVNAARLYYGTDVRAQAFVIGIAAAFYFAPDRRGRRPELPLAVSHAIGWIGTAVSLAAFFVLDETSIGVFAGGGMLVFAVAAALMGVSALDPRPMLLNRVISVSPLVHLGQVSYGLYLFHWPIGLWWQRLDLHPVVSGVTAFALSWVLAVASYRLVEMPVLTGGLRRVLRRRGLSATAVTTGVVAAVTAVALVMAARTPALEDQPWDGRPIDAALTWREPAEPLRVAVVGDSVPASLLSGWDPGRYRGLEVLRYAEYGGCSATPVTMQVLDRQVPESPVCASWRQLWPREVREKGADVVLAPAGLRFVLPTVVDGEVVPPRSEQLRGLVEADLDAMREQTERSGAAQLDILNVPCRVLDGSSQPRQQLEQIRAQLGITDGELVLDPTWVNGVIDDWAARQGDDGPRVTVLDLDAQLCPGGRHQRVVGGALLYEEGVHFTPEGARAVWSWLAPAVVEAAGGR